MTLRIRTPAKINLSLHITSRREDGYHELVTRMQKIDLCDELQLELTDRTDVEFVCDKREIPAGDTNLAVQAARKYFERCSAVSGNGLRITLSKHIPVGAGLGGGSSDAAAVLKGLGALLGEPLSHAELLDIGRELGADVPFLVSEHAAVCATGIGDTLEKVASADSYHYLLVNPGFSVSTKWVYDNYRLTKKDKKFNLCGSQNDAARPFSANELHNDLEQVTLAHYPVLGQIKNALLQAGAAGALMSGSGPTMFGVFESRKKAEAAQILLTHDYSTEGFRIISAEAFDGA